ncbi:MAG: Ku protein [Planctomycetes bacterium]|nr:Ku protein [Planctomycetota bacterium]
MARPIWKGHISFGLVNVPVVLYPAERRADLSFKLIDSRNAARVKYERVNEESGEEVPWDKIVKGYEFDGGNYVLLSEEELEQASVEMTRTIEIEQFVDVDEIDPMYFDRPYYLVPDKGGEKGYVLLREAMAASSKIGISKVVIRARQSLAALMPRDESLILELLRFPQELRPAADYDFPTDSPLKYKISKKEIAMAGQLIKGMTGAWKPNTYHDEYRDALMKMIESKIASGETEAIESNGEEPEAESGTINFADALKKSLARATRSPKKQAVPQKRRRKPATRKKRAG